MVEKESPHGQSSSYTSKRCERRVDTDAEVSEEVTTDLGTEGMRRISD